MIRFLPPESAWQRIGGASTPLEENVASLLDFVAHETFSAWRRNTFDPESFAEHQQLAKEAKQRRRRGAPPPALPPIVAVALRPVGSAALSEALTTPPPPAVEEVEGHEAHVRLQRVLHDT